jgi:hypothetical protein
MWSNDTTDKIDLRWHDTENGSAGGWSSTTSIVLS